MQRYGSKFPPPVRAAAPFLGSAPADLTKRESGILGATFTESRPRTKATVMTFRVAVESLLNPRPGRIPRPQRQPILLSFEQRQLRDPKFRNTPFSWLYDNFYIVSKRNQKPHQSLNRIPPKLTRQHR